LEAGNGLRKAGLEVSVVEFFPRLLPRQTDVAGAALLQRQMEEMGSAFTWGKDPRDRFGPGRAPGCPGRGPELPAQLVLISAGVRPELTLAKALNLTVDKGIKVDDHMYTGLKGVYAAGDLIEHRGRFYGICLLRWSRVGWPGPTWRAKREPMRGRFLPIPSRWLASTSWPPGIWMPRGRWNP